MKIVACIFARGGSKGLPNKNILDFAGKPLIAWAVEQALALSTIDEVFVSTDSVEIRDIAQKFGASVPFIRPSELASDDSPEWMAWRYMMIFFLEHDGKMLDAKLSVPTTTPLRSTSDIQRCIDAFEPGVTDAIVTVTDPHRSKYINIVKFDEYGFADVVMSNDSGIRRRQGSPNVFDMTTAAYVVNSDFIMVHDGLFEGRIKAVHLPIERAIDIETLLDFEIVEYLFLHREGNLT